MRVTLLPSTVNVSASATSFVHEFRLSPIRSLEPLARLINWSQPGELLIIVTKRTPLTDDLPLPVAPMTLWQRLG